MLSVKKACTRNKTNDTNIQRRVDSVSSDSSVSERNQQLMDYNRQGFWYVDHRHIYNRVK
jgi:hypothetical protein